MRSECIAALVVSVVTGCAASAPSPDPSHASRRPTHRASTPDAPAPPPKPTEKLTLVGVDGYEQHDATWSRPVAPSMRQEASALAVDARGDVVIAGASWPRGASAATKADVFVTKFDSGGLDLWRKRVGDAEHQSARGAAVDAKGNVVVAGVFHGTIDFGGAKLTSAGESDIFVAKLDTSGKHVWSKRFGGKGKDDVAGVAIDAVGDVWFAGATSKALDFGDKKPEPGGGAFVAKLDALGKKLEGRSLTATPTAMALDAKSVAFAGASADGVRFVTKIDHARADQMTALLRAMPGVGGESELDVRGIAIDSAGAVVVVGDFLGEIAMGDTKLRYAQFDATNGDVGSGKHDAFVLKIDAAGRLAWAMRYGAFGDDRATGVSIDNLDNVLVTGAFEKTVDFGGGPMRATGSAQLFVLKLDATGHVVWSTTYDAGGASARVANDASGNSFLVGELRATTDFGGGPVLGVAQEMFLAKLPP